MLMQRWRTDGAKLRDLRRTRGIRLIDLAREAGNCSYRHLQQVETGRPAPGRNVSIELGHRLAAALTRLSGDPVAIDDFMAPVDDEAHKGRAA